ncbi:MAG TPA: DNA mismatch repair endonuclease MutL, partial [Ktedonobacterales bacterium]|nr:DNA mismatch repair endonuclease MutL [Ktedonobacterales bacterium]
MLKRIAPLTREVVERIAAGEVIERPASVVRELIDNALDASATTIRIEIQDGGLRLIRVQDDGMGIYADDLPLTVTPHATSKVRSLADLEHITTLGFRGEALASIAAVAEVEIVSAAVDHGIARVLRAGPDMPTMFDETPRSRGTTVTARSLFATVPARRALLRSSRVEMGRSLAVVRAYALAHPGVHFTLVSDGAVALQTTGTDRAEAIEVIYGSDVARTLLTFGPERVGEATISGMVAARAFHSANRDHVLLVVNGRPVTNRGLLAALESGYRPLLRKGRHPLLIAEVMTPANQVDANIHPSKAEVLLSHEQSLAAALRETIHTAMGQAPLSALEGTSNLANVGFSRSLQLRFPQRRSRRAMGLAEQSPLYGAHPEELTLDADTGEWEPLAQFDNTLILARTSGGQLLLVDQHRAHERIL